MPAGRVLNRAGRGWMPAGLLAHVGCWTEVAGTGRAPRSTTEGLFKFQGFARWWSAGVLADWQMSAALGDGPGLPRRWRM